MKATKHHPILILPEQSPPLTKWLTTITPTTINSNFTSRQLGVAGSRFDRLGFDQSGSGVQSEARTVGWSVLLAALVKRSRESLVGVLGFTHFTHLSFGQTSPHWGPRHTTCWVRIQVQVQLAACQDGALTAWRRGDKTWRTWRIGKDIFQPAPPSPTDSCKFI